MINTNMKNFLKYALFMLCFAAMAACSSGGEGDEGGNEPDDPGKPDKPAEPELTIAGSWKLTDWSLDSNKLIESGGIQVYLDCAKNNTFILYQLTATNADFKKLTGSYSIKSKVISGSYQNGSKWANSYTIKELNATTMKWEYGSDVTMTYTATDIPREIVDNARSAVTAVRSDMEEIEEELTVIL